MISATDCHRSAVDDLLGFADFSDALPDTSLNLLLKLVSAGQWPRPAAFQGRLPVWRRAQIQDALARRKPAPLVEIFDGEPPVDGHP
jgi:hypothetical protein